jgi:hypothetical protein
MLDISGGVLFTAEVIYRLKNADVMLGPKSVPVATSAKMIRAAPAIDRFLKNPMVSLCFAVASVSFQNACIRNDVGIRNSAIRSAPKSA